MKKLLLLSLLLVIPVLAGGGCTVGSGVTINSQELNTSTRMSMLYDRFTGHRQTKITVKDEPVTVKVNIVTEKGDIDAYIARDNDKAGSVYEGNGITTSSSTVTLNEPGSYTLRVDANNHTGSYSFFRGE